jgi:3-hydroxyisobutyrate dehydrogenase
MSRIAFIGLGAMGAGMAANQAKAGHEVRAFDLSAAALEKAAGAGCRIASSTVEAIKDAEIVITMLPAGAQVREVWSGEVIPNASPTALIIDCSTIEVATARSLGGAASAAGLAAADAPVSGGIMGAEAGTLAFMVGCEEAIFPRVELALGPMAKVVIHAGGAGAGQAAKICNNMLLGISMAGVCEAFALAEKLGLDAQRFFDIASKSSGQTYCPWPGPVPSAPSNHAYEGGFLTRLMLKDLKLSQQAAANSGAATPLGAHAAALYALFDGLGYGGKDFSALLQLVRGRLSELN